MQPVYLAGTGMTKFGKDHRPLAVMMREAAEQALAGAEVNDIDAIFIGSMNPEEFTGDSNLAAQMAEGLGRTGVPATRVETASSAGAAALMAGFQAIASGYCRRVLVVAGEKMIHLSTSVTTRILAEVLDKRERLCGATMPALAAMITEKYRQRFRLSSSRLSNMLCAVALKNHRNGAANPHAQFQRAITIRFSMLLSRRMPSWPAPPWRAISAIKWNCSKTKPTKEPRHERDKQIQSARPGHQSRRS